MQCVSYPGVCSSCGKGLSRKEVVDAVVLDVTGWRAVQHEIRRCRKFGCPLNYASVAHNFVCTEKQYVFSWEEEEEENMDFFFLTVSFGMTISWLRQFSRRLIYHRASFAGEAQIHLLEAIGLGKKDIVPAKAKAKLLRAWMLWRLVTWQSF